MGYFEVWHFLSLPTRESQLKIDSHLTLLVPPPIDQTQFTLLGYPMSVFQHYYNPEPSKVYHILHSLATLNLVPGSSKLESTASKPRFANCPCSPTKPPSNRADLLGYSLSWMDKSDRKERPTQKVGSSMLIFIQNVHSMHARPHVS
jgi:hypothetical protein